MVIPRLPGFMNELDEFKKDYRQEAITNDPDQRYHAVLPAAAACPAPLWPRARSMI